MNPQSKSAPVQSKLSEAKKRERGSRYYVNMEKSAQVVTASLIRVSYIKLTEQFPGIHGFYVVGVNALGGFQLFRRVCVYEEDTRIFRSVRFTE